MNMYTYIHVHPIRITHTCMHTYSQIESTHTFIYLCKHAHILADIHIHTYEYTNVIIYNIYIYTYVSIYRPIVHITHRYVRSYMHTYIHSCIQTLIHGLFFKKGHCIFGFHVIMLIINCFFYL